MPTRRLSIDKKVYTKVNVGLGAITFQAYRGQIFYAFSATQPELASEVRHILPNREHRKFEKPDADLWILATEEGQAVVVTEEANTTEITDRGSAGDAVFIQDQTTGILDVPFLRTLSTPTLAANTIVNDRDIQLSPGHGLTVGNIGEIIELADSTNGSFFTQCQITDVTGDIIELECPVNRIYTTTESLVAHSSQDMNVDGSTTPVIFSILPFALQKGDMVRCIPEFRGANPMDFETFGDLPALANGIVMRVNNGDGTYRNLYNFKDNGDVIKQCFDHDFFTNIGNNSRAMVARLTWGGQSKRGVVIRLEGDIFESLEIVVQDNLTGMTRHHWTGNGSELQQALAA